MVNIPAHQPQLHALNAKRATSKVLQRVFPVPDAITALFQMMRALLLVMFVQLDGLVRLTVLQLA
jgi:hypothetical protein